MVGEGGLRALIFGVVGSFCLLYCWLVVSGDLAGGCFF